MTNCLPLLRIDAAPGGYVCRCLKVTEAEVIACLSSGQAGDLSELRACTGAGDGCTACRRRLQGYVERYALPLAGC